MATATRKSKKVTRVKKSAAAATPAAVDTGDEIIVQPVKRGRGRPKGSKRKASKRVRPPVEATPATDAVTAAPKRGRGRPKGTKNGNGRPKAARVVAGSQTPANGNGHANGNGDGRAAKIKRIREDGAKIAKVWGVLTGHPFTPGDVALCLMATSMVYESGESRKANHDSLSDYAAILPIVARGR